MEFLKRFTSSLIYPMTAILVLVTVLPVAMVGFFLADYNREHLRTFEKQSLTRQAVNLASEISLQLASHQSELDGIRRVFRTMQLDEAQKAELLRATAEDSHRVFLYLQIAGGDGNGAFVRDPGFSDDLAVSMAATLSEAHRKALAGNSSRILRLDLPEAHAPLLLLAQPLKGPDGEIRESLIAVLDLEPIIERLEETATGGQFAGLFDEMGRIIAASPSGVRGRDFSSSPLVADFLKTPVRLTRIYESSNRPDPVVGSVAGVAGTRWGLLVERSTKEAFAPVRGMLMRTWIVSGLAGIAALAIGLFMARRLVSPIVELDRVSTEIAEGNLTVRAPVVGHHEIAHLASNFNNMAGNIEALVRRLRQALRQNQELFLETIRTLATAIDAKDPYTRGHSERVSSYSMAIARHLGLSPDQVFRIRIAAILHDVGKLGVRDSILNKPGRLTEEEFSVMRRHPAIGAQIMAPIRMLKDIIPGIRNHHETWDGKGYPDGLKGEAIPQVARIIGAADTFDAMTTTRPYQEAMSLEFVLAKMRGMAGTRFDPKIVDALIDAVNSGDITPPDAAHGGAPPQTEAS